MNLDISFCVTEKCPVSDKCDRHIDRLKEWKDKGNELHKNISAIDCFEDKEHCDFFIERDEK